MNLNTRQSLALRYRPKRLSEMVGQSEAVATVQGYLDKEACPNSFMIVGPSGTGKTTLSRLIARHMNCADLSACGQCESCKAMDRGNDGHPDYKEVNGAESGGVDTIRALIETARYRPTHNLRIIHIDEVHRSTNAAMNSLLKPLEEPPPSTLWILSTTDPDRIPNAKAVMGRCIYLSLGQVAASDMARHVHRVGRKERLKWLDKDAAKAVAKAAAGQVRDALQIVETVNAQAGSNATVESVSKLIRTAGLSIGADESRLAMRILLGCYTHKPKTVAQALLETKDHHALVYRLLDQNHYLLMVRCLGDGKHAGLWADQYGRGLVRAVADKAASVSIGDVSAVHDTLTRCRIDTAVQPLREARHTLAARLIGHAAVHPDR